MIRFDAKNSVNKTTFIKAMQHLQQGRSQDSAQEGSWETEKFVLSSTLREIEETSDKNAVGLLNNLFISSTSHVLDKVCLNIFSKLGDEQSLQLLHRKYPTPESISISLLPYYIRVLQFLGEAREVELLARIANTFWGLYRAELLAAFEDITRRTGSIEAGDEVVRSMQYLFEAGDESEKARVLALCDMFRDQLLLSVILCGIESDASAVRKAAINTLGAHGSPAAMNALRRAFQNEIDESLLEEYEKWLFTATKQDSSLSS